MYIFDDEVRRADFKLRIQYPELDTKIYKESSHRFIIFCEGYEGDFNNLKKEFKDSIRTIGCPVEVSQMLPTHHLEILQPISMDNPVFEFRAAVLTENDVKNFVESRFPDVEIKGIQHNAGAMYSVEITVSTGTSKDRIEEMKKVLTKCLSTDEVSVRCDEGAEQITEPPYENEPQSLYIKMLSNLMEASSLSLNRHSLWAADEADYWFSHVEEIYLNEHEQQDVDSRIRIPYFRYGQKSCFMDCTVYGTHLDIRQVLVLYDTVYIGMPMKRVQETFFQSQMMTKDELLTLVSMGKVVLIITGLERNYDVEFLNMVYKESPLGIIGRRAANTLVAAYLSELQWRYTKNHPDIYQYTRDLYRLGHQNGNRNLIALADAAIYPIKAKAQSFAYLNTNGLMNLSIFGVNTVYESMFQDQLSEMQKENMALNFMADAYPIHLAEALNATYIPYRDKKTAKIHSDFYLADLQESLLMQYWYGDFQIEQIKNSRLTNGIEQLKLFHAEKGLSVVDIAESADKWNTPKSFGDIVQNLTGISKERQNEKIREYNHLLFEIAKQSDKKSFIEMMLTGAGYVPMNDILSGCITLLGLMSDFANSRKYMQEYNEKKQYKRKLKVKKEAETDQALLDDILILDKIHRVARLTPVE